MVEDIEKSLDAAEYVATQEELTALRQAVVDLADHNKDWAKQKHSALIDRARGKLGEKI